MDWTEYWRYERKKTVLLHTSRCWPTFSSLAFLWQLGNVVGISLSVRLVTSCLGCAMRWENDGLLTSWQRSFVSAKLLSRIMLSSSCCLMTFALCYVTQALLWNYGIGCRRGGTVAKKMKPRGFQSKPRELNDTK